MARPSSYNEAMDDQVYKLALLGLDEVEIAGIIGVSKATITNWKQRHPSFLAALKNGKTPADGEVVASLYKRALGYEATEVKTEGILDEKTGKAIGKKVTRTVKHIAPDVTAQIYWLKNRQRGRWKDRWVTAEDAANEMAPVTNITYVEVDASKPE